MARLSEIGECDSRLGITAGSTAMLFLGPFRSVSPPHRLIREFLPITLTYLKF
jgi:hypothetical protein